MDEPVKVRVEDDDDKDPDSTEEEPELLLASLPQELARFDLDRYRERPMLQAELAELLLMPKSDARFTSCVLLFGMGGTGKVNGF